MKNSTRNPILLKVATKQRIEIKITYLSLGAGLAQAV
jgi:hypothetical protein